MNIKKIITILNYLAGHVHNCSKLKVLKLLYYIDKKYLIKHGRFVTGDTYYKYQYGPVPTFILNFIDEGEKVLEREMKKYLSENLSFADNKYRSIRSLKAPDLDELSIAEIDIIDEVIKEYGNMKAHDLVEKTHQEPAWINSTAYSQIEIESMLDGLSPDKQKEILNRFNSDSKTEKALNRLLA